MKPKTKSQSQSKSLPKSKPKSNSKEDPNQATFRVFQEITRRSEAISGTIPKP
jgi:hypothetical protein